VRFAVNKQKFDDVRLCSGIQFAKAILMTDNFEVYPLENGRIRVAFMFYRMMREIR